MRGFFLGYVFGIVTALVGCHPAHAQQPDLHPKGEPEWEAATPENKDPKHIQPPRGSFGFQGCGQYAIWIFLADGKSYRIDSDHQPKTKDDMQKLLDWLNSGPSDIVEIKCGASV